MHEDCIAASAVLHDGAGENEPGGWRKLCCTIPTLVRQEAEFYEAGFQTGGHRQGRRRIRGGKGEEVWTWV